MSGSDGVTPGPKAHKGRAPYEKRKRGYKRAGANACSLSGPSSVGWRFQLVHLADCGMFVARVWLMLSWQASACGVPPNTGHLTEIIDIMAPATKASQ